MNTFKKFNSALQNSESKSLSDLDSQWCVCIGHGVFLSCPLSYAIDKDYHIVCITIY